MLDGEVTAELEPEERQPDAGQARVGPVVGLELARERRRLQNRAVGVRSAALERRQVASHVSGRGVGGAGSRRQQLAIGHRPGAAGPERVSGREASRDPLGAVEVGVRHAQGVEHVLAQVAREGLPAHVLDELAERGEPTVGVPQAGARLGHHPGAAAVVGRECGQGPSQRDALPEVRQHDVRGAQNLGKPGGVGEQMPHRRGPEAGPGRDQPVGAKVVVRGGVEIDQPLLGQLHHRDGRERLGDGGDPKDGVLGDARVRRQVGEPVSVEERERPVAHHADRQADGGPAVDELADSGLHLALIELEHDCLRPTRGATRAGRRTRRARP